MSVLVPAPPSRFLLPLGLAVVVVVVLEAALGPVGLGTTGRPLLLTASTAVYAVTGASSWAARPSGRRPR